MTDILTTIREQIPGYTERRDHLAAVQAELARRQGLSSALNPYEAAEVRELREMLEAGEALDGLDQRIAARISVEQAGAAARIALTELRTQLESELKACESDPSTVLPLLGTAMADRVAQAKALAPLDEIATPEAAVRSKRFDDAARLAEILADMVALRLEQLRVLREAGHEWGPKVSVLLAIRNPVQVFADWGPWLRPGYLEHRTSDKRRELQPPWARPLQSALITTDFAMWALQAGADLWIPTLDEYEREAKALREKAAQPRHDDGRHGEWRDPGPERRYERPTNVRSNRRAGHVIER